MTTCFFAVGVCVTTVAGADLSTGAAAEALGDFVEAIKSGEASRIARHVAVAPTAAPPIANIAEQLAIPEAGRMVLNKLSHLEVRSVDVYLRGPGFHTDGAPQGAARVLCRAPAKSKSASAVRETMYGLFFVQTEGRWCFYWPDSEFPWLSWDYDWGAPENAHRSLQLALDWRDFRTLYESIDPALLPPNVSLPAWLNAVEERQGGIDKWEADCAAARAVAKAEGRPQPADSAPPFVVIAHRAHAASARYEDDGRTVAHVSHLWDHADEMKGPVPYETFVKRGDRWYWQPKSEYTLWPLVTNTPASQATDRSAGSESAPGVRGQALGGQPTSKAVQQELDRTLQEAKIAWARHDCGNAEQLAKEVVEHPQATDEQKRRAQLILDRVAKSRGEAPTSQPGGVGSPASQPAALPASQPSSAPAR